ncbi:GNAT family N-acetyltransferase [Selenomonas ruminantium]|uniref:Ribosomal-protein-alanine N-acetyltransferase n=1 Tax=Selenomonas ruminantium TaxID=971 RepID=A0A1H4A6Z8_SELRU|nr:GNAT family N-acetyltransferase [Selenomonas ruminantium]SEA31224.1 ribosomal-protein-alanine N-acetyltransferase [Selenomonas ruminantium]
MKRIELETERLRLYITSQSEMEKIIERQTDEELRKAYQEMLDGYLAHPEQGEWYAIWMVTRHDGVQVGDLSFKGFNEDGSVEIGYGIIDEFQGQGYATEAVKAAVNWALKQAGVLRVEAETEQDNTASQRVLAKCGFVPSGIMGEEGPRYVRR